MKELIKPNLTEEEYEEKEVTGYCDNTCGINICWTNEGDDEAGDILF